MRPRPRPLPTMMKLLWLSHFLPYPPKGGAPQRSYHLLRQAAASHEVHLAAVARQAVPGPASLQVEAEQAFAGFLASYAGFPPRSTGGGLQRALVAVLAGLGVAPYDVASLRNRRLRLHLQDRGSREHFDLVHVDTIGLWPFTAAFPRTPVVLHHHNVESQLTSRRATLERNPLKRAYLHADAAKLRRLERQACPRAVTNIVVSELDATRLLQVAPRSVVSAVDNGVDLAYFTPDPAACPTPGSLVFAGGMNWYPNREAALLLVREIWPEVVRCNATASLVLLGQDPLPELRRLADPRVQAPGFVADVRPYLNAAELYVCPIRNGGGTRLKILDALAMAKPLVATALAVEGLDLIEGEHYLRAETTADFVSAILRLQQDAALRAALARAGRRLVERRYSWTLVGQRLNEVYEAALDAWRPT